MSDDPKVEVRCYSVTCHWRNGGDEPCLRADLHGEAQFDPEAGTCISLVGCAAYEEESEPDDRA